LPQNTKKEQKEHLFSNKRGDIIDSVEKEKRTGTMRDMDNNAHSVFLLYYHLIMVTRYRRKVFDEQISARGKEIFEYIAPKYGITLEEWNHDEDHVHVMFRAQPKSEISKFINAYKSASSRLLKKNTRRYGRNCGRTRSGARASAC
jgi:putative transposase